MKRRLRPDRVLPFMADDLSAEVARQCIAEWSAYADDHECELREVCERMAILIDLGRQQCALTLERSTPWSCPAWAKVKYRASITERLVAALRDRPEDMPDGTVNMIRVEVERPWQQWLARRADR